MITDITNPIFHDEAKALAHLEASRWNGEPNCPHCGSTRVHRMGGKTQAGMFLCNDCRDKFTVRTGSVMERSHVPLHKWLLATHIMAASKKGMSASQMARMIGVTYKTAWFLCHRIREAMDGATGNDPLGRGPTRVVEADETYVGGKAINRAWGKIPTKKPVVALVEREGHVRSFHVANVTAKSLRALIVTNVDRKAHLMTDESPMYKAVGREMRAHTTVVHSKAQYDLPPSGWSEINVILDTEGKDECHSRNTRRRRLSASCVRRRLCWRRAGRPQMPVVGYRSASRPITVGARSMAV
ncbi:IS1595 family transposase [Sphingorhabdus contaminans]|uniref:IS1595 family transposase n=1 Tax=Sphingorhabdus contaminans TaxID=1343899 RepID=UPI003D2B526E